MFDDLLPQICQIIKMVQTNDEWNPINQTEQIVLDNVPCRFDSIMVVRGVTPLEVADQVNVPNRVGGLMFIGDYYGVGSSRLFNEQNLIKFQGYNWKILAIHEVFAASDFHHYELEIYRGVNR